MNVSAERAVARVEVTESRERARAGSGAAIRWRSRIEIDLRKRLRFGVEQRQQILREAKRSEIEASARPVFRSLFRGDSVTQVENCGGAQHEHIVCNRAAVDALEIQPAGNVVVEGRVRFKVPVLKQPDERAVAIRKAMVDASDPRVVVEHVLTVARIVVEAGGCAGSVRQWIVALNRLRYRVDQVLGDDVSRERLPRIPPVRRGLRAEGIVYLIL